MVCWKILKQNGGLLGKSLNSRIVQRAGLAWDGYVLLHFLQWPSRGGIRDDSGEGKR